MEGVLVIDYFYYLRTSFVMCEISVYNLLRTFFDCEVIGLSFLCSLIPSLYFRSEHDASNLIVSHR